MPIALYTMHSAALAKMAAITVPNKTEYCYRHGYYYYQTVFDGKAHPWPGYDRLPYLIDLLRSGAHEWVFWLGTDCLITNFAVRLEDLTDRNVGMVIATDATEVQMDSFLVQAGCGGIELLDAIWNDRNLNFGKNYEQSNLQAKMSTESFRSVVKILPQRAMNSFNYSIYPDSWGTRFKTHVDCLGTNGDWQPGDFVFHVPGKGLDEKFSELKRIAPLVKKDIGLGDLVKTVVTSDPLSSPRVCILSAYDSAYTKLAERTVYQNKAEYARRWSHDLLTLTGVNPAFINPASHVNGITWDRLREAMKIARTGKYDWLYLVGSDTLITNMTIPLSSIIDDAYHFIIANDFNEWNADSFFIRCSPQGIAYMDEVMQQYGRLKNHKIVEQQAMIELRDKHKVWKAVPQRKLNAYNMELYFDHHPNGTKTTNCIGEDANWQPGDFLIHWAGQPTDVRFAELEKVWPKIIR